MNHFYDIYYDNGIKSNFHQLEKLGEQRTQYSISTSEGITNIYRPTTSGDYDNVFIETILSTNPPYLVDEFLDHHYTAYEKKLSGSKSLFLKHIKYVIIPSLGQGIYSEIVTDWLESQLTKKEGNTQVMAINQKLNKILEFVVANPKRINITPHTVMVDILDNSISLNEARKLHQKIIDTGVVRQISRHIAWSIDTQEFLNDGGFLTSQEREAAPTSQMTDIENDTKGEVFISYSWDSKAHEESVLQFTDFLRKKGFNAQLDKMLTQRETSINFVKMMHKAMIDHPKVIVILSEGYKLKAEAFTGGVGEEYELLLNDIKKTQNKYILVSFVKRSDHITPLGLQGRDIIDLTKEGNMDLLFRKLLDEPQFVFSKVADKKPHLEPDKIVEFFLDIDHSQSVLEILTPYIQLGDTGSQGGLYKYVEFGMELGFKNISSKTIEGFGYSLKIKRELVPETYELVVEDGYLTFNGDITQTAYPQRTLKSPTYKLKVASHTILQILNTFLTVSVYTDAGVIIKDFKVEELLKVSPPNKHHKDSAPLNREMFQ